jgi:3-mercaptopyruvate sulfurtransferase SseA
VAFKLKQLGFTRIRPLFGGLEAWIDAGMPVDADEAAGTAAWNGEPAADGG